MDRWIIIDAERALYVDRGRDVILCDRGHSGPVTLVLKVSERSLRAAVDEFHQQPPPGDAPCGS